jgi:divalent metal cation (Fe/Co/Zn/Cd) transporter
MMILSFICAIIGALLLTIGVLHLINTYTSRISMAIRSLKWEDKYDSLRTIFITCGIILLILARYLS